MSNKKTKGALLREIGAKASVGMLVISAGTPALELYANPTTESSSKAAVSSSELTSETSTVEVPPIESSTNPPETSESSSQSSTDPSTSTSSSTQPSTSTPTPPTSSTSPSTTPPSSTKPSTTPSSSAPAPGSSSKPATSTSTGSSTATGTSSSSGSAIKDGSITYSKNQSTSEFIDKIGKDASQVADKNGIYASVMIAQAILESASGNSTLAREPNFNLFGIKGKYEGATVGMPTLEDDGKGSMYTITAEFRKYPGYKESLEDYARLIKGVGSTNPLYKGTWKTEAKTYQEATLFLTGRYATDTRYNQKLNGLIETYDLQRFDNLEKVKTKVKVTRHKVAENETLWDISKKYGVTMSRIKELNKMTEEAKLEPASLIVVKREKYVEKEVTDKQATAVKVATAASTKSLLAQTKLKKELQLEKETKQLALLKVSQMGTAMSNAVPSVLFESKTFKIAGKQVKSDKTHYVEKNESITDISKKVGIPINKLIEWNNLQDSILTEGQVLIIDSPLNSQI
ncbi:glucosaminidase domain-containing protein [uncultured Vagococcus sp.]|uniref:glucosaminidase domain-containing protein n=1 Tax=uncultured Vagococcus sp. TaxID=189676 RepID=UPI0028D2F971|nr:glucosaminidase domain-containing protein [uncultured Vagococcus sp.]